MQVIVLFIIPLINFILLNSIQLYYKADFQFSVLSEKLKGTFYLHCSIQTP